MNAKLSYANITAIPKKGMVVEINNEFYQIESYIDKSTIDIKCMSLEDGRTIKTITYQDAYNSICKFIATYKSKDREIACSICHNSLQLLLQFLDRRDKEGIENWDHLRNRDELIIEGDVDMILSSVKKGATVQITEIAIIDKHKLYDPSNRICTVTSIDRFNHTLHNVHLGIAIHCRRKHFKVLSDNEYYLFKLKCDVCNR